MKRVWLIASFLLAAAVAQAAPTIGRITATASTCTTGVCVIAQVPQSSGSPSGTVLFQVTGTYTGTITFEGSPDGTTWYSLTCHPIPTGSAVSSTTSTGAWRAQGGGLVKIRARGSASMTGAAQILLNTSPTNVTE
jgi:hypothetical protein